MVHSVMRLFKPFHCDMLMQMTFEASQSWVHMKLSYYPDAPVDERNQRVIDRRRLDTSYRKYIYCKTRMQLGFILERSCEGGSISFLNETARQALYPIE